jgi:hypothetical protein
MSQPGDQPDPSDSLVQDEIREGLDADPVAKSLVRAGTPEPTMVSSTQTLSPLDVEEIHAREVDREERTSLIDLRRRYSKWLGRLLAAQLLFMNTVVILLGCHALALSPVVIQVYVTGTLGEVFGLVAVATNFLFSDKPPLGVTFARKPRKRASR